MHNGIPVRYGKPTRRNGSKFPIIIILLILIILAAGYLVYNIVTKDEPHSEEAVEETPVVTDEESVEKEPEEDVKDTAPEDEIVVEEDEEDEINPDEQEETVVEEDGESGVDGKEKPSESNPVNMEQPKPEASLEQQQNLKGNDVDTPAVVPNQQQAPVQLQPQKNAPTTEGDAATSQETAVPPTGQ